MYERLFLLLFELKFLNLWKTPSIVFNLVSNKVNCFSYWQKKENNWNTYCIGKKFKTFISKYKSKLKENHSIVSINLFENLLDFINLTN